MWEEMAKVVRPRFVHLSQVILRDAFVSEYFLKRKHEFWTYMHVLRSGYLHKAGGLWEHRGRPHHHRHLHHRRRLSPHHSPLKLSLVFKILRWSERNIGGNMCLLFGSNKCRPALNFWEIPNKFRPGLFFRECLNDIQPFACKNKIAFGLTSAAELRVPIFRFYQFTVPRTNFTPAAIYMLSINLFNKHKASFAKLKLIFSTSQVHF